MIRIEYKENGNRIETKWINETTASSSMLGRVILPKDVFETLRDVSEYTTCIYFIEKKDV